jgi:hypothetical protein
VRLTADANSRVNPDHASQQVRVTRELVVDEEPDARLRRVAAALDDARRELIDISRRNRLLHSPRMGRRIHCLEFANVDSDAVFAELAREGKAFAFAVEGENTETEIRPRTLPTLRAQVTPEVLERRLVKFFREARVIEEEQGVNILFLVSRLGNI